MNDRSYSKEELVIPTLCQYCLADPRYTPIAELGITRCPVCGAAYSGPRRDTEYRAIVNYYDDITKVVKDLLGKDKITIDETARQLGPDVTSMMKGETDEKES